jgi:hypothetical protein
VPVILIKANVCKVLDPRLVKDGVRVLNHGIRPPFPTYPPEGTRFSGLRHLLRFEDIFGSGRRHSTCDHQARAWEGNDKKITR